jgi:Ca-activated chloride channel family protein
MIRTRYLIAASVACIIAASGITLNVLQSPELRLPETRSPLVEPSPGNDVGQHASSLPQPKTDDASQQQAQLQDAGRVPGEIASQASGALQKQEENVAPATAAPTFVTPAAAPLVAAAPVEASPAPPTTVLPPVTAVPAPVTTPPPPALLQPAPAKRKMEEREQVAELATPFAPAAPDPKSAPKRIQQAMRPAIVGSRSAAGGGGAQAPGLTAQLRTRQLSLEAPRERQSVVAEVVGRERFANAPENPFKFVRETPVSTFSIDVDTASYSFMRASLNRNVLPQPSAVRTEELINYFPYAYEPPASADEPFRASVAVFPNPWWEGRKLIRIGIKGYALREANRPRANLVFLIDTSGSMEAQDRLPLVKQSLAMLVTQLKPEDRVAIVTYAGEAGTALEPTSVSEKAKILAVIDRLEAGGSTAGGEGIRQAYQLAERNYDATGVNRVILATDGDFNVGITSKDELKGFVERERSKGIFLSVLGYGVGNYNDALAQALAQNGNGVAVHIDTINEARKVLVEEASSALFPIGKDVKIQVEFNPAMVAEYRLIGYETRLLNRDDFNNDKVDAGDVGSGQTVTALYDIAPAGGPRVVDDLRYRQKALAAADVPATNEYAFVKIRYKLPKSDQSALITTPVDRSAEHSRFEDAPVDARFATSVAAFGEILRGGKHTGKFSLDDVLKIATAARGDDPYGYRTEFLQLVRAAKTARAIRSQRP